MYKLKITAPFFPGFYNTCYEIDDALIESEIAGYVVPRFGKANLMRPYGFFTLEDIVNEYWGTNASTDATKNYKQEVGQETTLFFERLLQRTPGFEESTVKFVDIWSPKEYNFHTDQININVTLDITEMIKILEGPAWAIFEAVVKNDYTSCDGFSSFYTNDAKVWRADWEKTLDDATMAGTCFEALCAYLITTEEDLSNRCLELVITDCESELLEYVTDQLCPDLYLKAFMLELLLAKMGEIVVAHPGEMADAVLDYPVESSVGELINPILSKCASNLSFRHTVKGSLTSQAKEGLKKLSQLPPLKLKL